MVDVKTVKECATIAMDYIGHYCRSDDPEDYGSQDTDCGCGANIAREILERFGVKMMVKD